MSFSPEKAFADLCHGPVATCSLMRGDGPSGIALSPGAERMPLKAFVQDVSKDMPTPPHLKQFEIKAAEAAHAHGHHQAGGHHAQTGARHAVQGQTAAHGPAKRGHGGHDGTYRQQLAQMAARHAP